MSEDPKLALDAREGLPEHLRVLADLYPRATWRGHANFDQLTAFWLDRHVMFRTVSSRLIGETQGFLDGADAKAYGGALSHMAGFFLNELHGHHGIEDHHYFPQLVGLDARLGAAFELLDSDHHALDAHIHDFARGANTVLHALREGGDVRAEAGRLLDHQRAFAGFLDRHLNDEEEIVVPIILEYGPKLG